MVNSYRDLKVWQQGMALSKAVYVLTRRYPKEEVFGITNQTRRASTSIPANIAEGYGRDSLGDYIHFLRVAQGSLKELETFLLLAASIEIVTNDAVQPMIDQADEIGKMLRSLIRKLELDRK